MSPAVQVGMQARHHPLLQLLVRLLPLVPLLVPLLALQLPLAQEHLRR